MTTNETLSTLPVFYCDQMVADSGGFSPSAAKPKPVVHSWLAMGAPISVHDVCPADDEVLCLAHSMDYVKKIFSGQQANGFMNKDVAIAETCRYTVGAMIDAGREAVANGKVAVAPVAGFHHARYAKGAGFCTFNGLVIAARALKSAGLVDRVGIVDCDVHFGDGTASLIELLELGNWLQHYTFGGQPYTTVEKSEELFRHLPSVLKGMSGCDLILYQAGADPHINDPLGGVMTTEQMLRRDELVFQECKAMQVPVAWNLAGGYQRDDMHGIRPVLDLHDNTMRACVRVYIG